MSDLTPKAIDSRTPRKARTVSTEEPASFEEFQEWMEKAKSAYTRQKQIAELYRKRCETYEAQFRELANSLHKAITKIKT